MTLEISLLDTEQSDTAVDLDLEESGPDDAIAGKPARHRCLMAGESVPTIPTMVEQMQLLWKAIERERTRRGGERLQPAAFASS